MFNLPSVRRLSLAVVLGATIAFTGCASSEDDDYLCTVPTTNNPNLIEDSGRSQMQMPNQF